tara:strand:- start:1994 stop:2311 length:318 start_codon:yes stop_codon:yes gene_type:complete
MFETTLSHSSFTNLNKIVIGKTGENVEALFSGQVEKTLLETPEVKVTVTMGYGNQSQKSDNDGRGNFKVVYTTPEGVTKIRYCHFSCDAADMVKAVYALYEEKSA